MSSVTRRIRKRLRRANLVSFDSDFAVDVEPGSPPPVATTKGSYGPMSIRRDPSRWFDSTDEQGAVREIFDLFLDAIEVGDYAIISRIMGSMVPHLSVYTTGILLAPLSITVPCRSKVLGREAYYQAVRTELEARGREDIEALLVGLE